MGGSGGRFYGGTTNDSRLAVLEAAAANEVQQADFSAKVGEYIAEVLSDANARDTEATSKHLDEVGKTLSSEVEEVVDLRFGGSVSKDTHVEGLSDVDCLAILKGKEFQNLNPAQVRERFADAIRERFPKTTVEVGTLAVTIRFSDMDVQILPALKTSTSVCIPTRTGQGWREIFPKEFRKLLTEVNQKQGGQVVPLIKVAKNLFANQPEQRRPEGYHLECLAADIFRNYNGEKTPRKMLTYFLDNAGSRLSQPMRDVTGQSVFVDEYLGQAGSLERRNLADSFSTLSRRLKNAEQSANFDRWKKIFEG